MLKLIEPLCEYRVNPLGLSTGEPRFSWKIETDKSQLTQTAYMLQISPNEDFSGEILESGLVESGESHLVSLRGKKFPSSTRYYWRVKIWDNKGEESPWSESSWFETSLLDNSEWKAVFISAEDGNAGPLSGGTILRKEFTLSKKPKSARLYAGAKGLYEAYCNDNRVGCEFLTPGFTQYDKRILFQTCDVTSLLKQGGNTLGFMVGAGWYKGDIGGGNIAQRGHFGKRTAVTAQLHVEYEDGTKETVVTDASWKCAGSPVTFSEIYHGENYDARLEEKCRNESVGNWKPVFVESADVSMLAPADGLPVKEHEHFKPLSLFTTPQGDRVIDFGQNIAGFVRFKVQGKAGDRVKLRHAETLDAKGNFYTENLIGARQTIEYILKGGGIETYSPHFTFQGFRYIAVDEYPGPIDMNDFEAVAIYSDMKRLGSFKSSSELLNQFVSNVCWSMKGNYVDIPTDCPQRHERLGWTGDAEIFIRSASLLMGIAPFFTKWLRDVSASQYADGRVPHVVPDVISNFVKNDELISSAAATGWADAVVIIPWTIYAYFGDKRLLEEQYPGMKKWVEYIRGVAQDGVLWNSGFHFGDWVALDAKEGSVFGATPNELIATAFYAYSTELLAKSAAVLGKQEEAAEYRELHGKIAEAFGKEFFTPKGKITVRTQTSCILALHFGLCPLHAKQHTLDTYVELLKEKNNHLTTGFLGTPFACRVLADNGRLDLAYELLFKTDFPSWLYQVTKGATTIWEHWDSLKPDGTMWNPGMNSFNHYAYGAVYDWVFTDVGGIDMIEEEPGFKKILLQPFPGGPLSWVETSYESPYGKIYLKWEKTGDVLKVDIVVPPSTSARVILPGAKYGIIGGVEFNDIPNGAQAELGSGSYSFSYVTKW
jgi:alpha-L-rhamnosidase